MVSKKGGRLLGKGAFGNAYTCNDTSVEKHALFNILGNASLIGFKNEKLDLNIFNKTIIPQLACKKIGSSIGKEPEENFKTEADNNEIIHDLFLNSGIKTALHDKILYYQFKSDKYLITKLFQKDATASDILWDKIILNKLLKDCIPFLNILNKYDYFHNDIALRNIFIDGENDFTIADYGNLITKKYYISSKRDSELLKFYKYSKDYSFNSNSNIQNTLFTINQIKKNYPKIDIKYTNLIDKLDLISLYEEISKILEKNTKIDFQLESINCIIDENIDYDKTINLLLKNINGGKRKKNSRRNKIN